MSFVHRMRSAFSLIEVLVATVIMSIVAAGIFSLVIYVQGSNLSLISNINLFGEQDKTSKFLRAKLGQAESVSIADAHGQDMACLELISRKVTEMKGYELAGQTAVTDLDYLGVTGNDPRTVSFWMWSDNSNASIKNLVKWGKHNEADRNFSVILFQDHRIGTDYSGNQMRDNATNPSPQLNDGEWHHVMVSYNGAHNSASSKIFIDGVEQTVRFIDQDLLQTGTDSSTNDYFRLGARDSSNNDAFSGVIGDLRVWDTALGATEAAEIFAGNQQLDSIAQANLQLHWRMRELPDNNTTVPDISGYNRDGLATGYDDNDLVFGTTAETLKATRFLFFDNDGDDYSALYYASGATECDDDPTGSLLWTQVSKEIYKPSPDGFFSSENSEPASVLLSFSSREDRDSTAYVASTTQLSKRLSSSKQFKDEQLCRADPAIRFGVEDSPPANCNISQAFALIESGYDEATDELYLQNATITSDNSTTTFSDIAFVPSTIIAEWQPSIGVMEFMSTDNATYPPSVWATALQSVAYRPLGKSYNSDKTLLFALGHLPFSVGGEFHYYDFVSIDVGESIDWGDAFSEARSDAREFCGMQGYLATVTSVEENNFLTDRFLDDDGGLPRGWLGGSDNGSEGDWTWRDGPEAGTQFWNGTGSSGNPMIVGGGTPVSSDYVTEIVDPDGALDGLNFRVERPVSSSMSFVYHRFEDDEPNNYHGGIEHYLQVCGLPEGNGVWNDLRASRECIAPDQPYATYRVCGYYVEYGGRTGEIDPGLSIRKNINLATQREHCAIDGLIVPETVRAISGLALQLSGILLTSDEMNDNGTISIVSDLPDTTLWLGSSTGVTITGDNTSNISLTGSVADLRAAIRTLNYLSPDGYFGDDGLNVSSTVNDAVFSKRTDVTVEPNCGNQTNGTATRFDIGYFDNTTSTFTTNSYVTSVSEWDNSEPIYYYGFCRGSEKRFDYASQQKLTGSSASCTGDYKHASTRLQGEHSDHDALSVFLYEEADEASRDRFSLFFIFDQYNNDCDDDLAGYNAQSTDAQKLNWARTEGSGIMGQLATSLGHERANVGQKRCHAKFRLNNIEPTRNLDDENDLHTFTDDPGEYAPAIIGTNGTMVGNVKWNGAHDGLVVPLRLPSTAQLNSDNQTELKDYDQGDPIFELLMRDNINRWRVRTLNVAKTDVEFRNFTIDDDGGTKVPAIKLNITKSQRCPK